MALNESTFSIGLTQRQEQALPIIALASSTRQGAIQAQIGRSTLRRWLNDPFFRSELQRLRDEASALAKSKLQAMLLKSILILDRSLESEDEALSQRAARLVIHAALRVEENDNITRRLDVLDDAVAILKKKK